MKNTHYKKRTVFSALRGIWHWLSIHLLGKTFTDFRIPALDLVFRVPSNTIFGWHLSKYRIYEANSLHFLRNHFKLGQSGLFVDVGANFGWYTLIFSQFAGPQGRVIALEPDVSNYRLLIHNQNTNAATNITTLQFAAGRENAKLVLGKAPDTNPGMHSLVDLPHVNKTQGGQVVHVRTLDNLLAPYLGYIELMKMDIEGYEIAALDGASETLKRCKMVLIEYSPAFIQAAGDNKQKFFDIFIAAGFDFYEIHADKLIPLTKELRKQLIERSDDPMYWQQDFFCINRHLVHQS